MIPSLLEAQLGIAEALELIRIKAHVMLHLYLLRFASIKLDGVGMQRTHCRLSLKNINGYTPNFVGVNLHNTFNVFAEMGAVSPPLKQ